MGYNLIEKVLNLIYPESIYCSCCESIIDRTRTYSLCDKCIRKIQWANGKTCSQCGKVIEGDWQGELCADCLETEHFFNKGFTCAEYNLYTRRIIFDLKYNAKTYLAKDIAKAMKDRMQLLKLEYDYMVPVPISKKKLRNRGFNQAELICRNLSKLVKVPYCQVLTRTKETTAQRGLGKIERYMNLKGAFEVKKYYNDKVKDRTILLIDDIYTTGATSDQCAEALKKAGARSVYVLTFTAGGNRHNS